MPKQRLQEVEILRPAAILLLVVMHSFTVFNGSWKPFEGYVYVAGYQWITRVTFSFMLELFVFISGYVLSYQIHTLNRNYQFGQFVWKKAKRLLLPSVIFSIVYFLCFQRDSFTTIPAFCYKILNGTGHLWFLPMMFFCCIIGFALLKTNICDKWKVLLAFSLSLFSGFFFILPLRLGNSLYYLFFFICGGVAYKNKEWITSKLTVNKVVSFWGIFVLSFLLFFLFIDPILMPNNMIGKGILLVVRTLGQIIYASFGVIASYSLVVYLLDKNNDYQVPTWLKSLNEICFGIYLFQQFILWYIYYYTHLPQMVGPCFLPWVSLVITLVTSYYLSLLFHKTKIGRFLIG